MSNKMWEVLVEHAKTCTLSGKVYIYYSDELENVAVVFNDIYALSGLIADGQYHSIDFLSHGQKVSDLVDCLLKRLLFSFILDKHSILLYSRTLSVSRSKIYL